MIKKKYLYVGKMVHPSGENWVREKIDGTTSPAELKIGSTNNLVKRETQLSRTKTPIEVEFIIAWDCDGKAYDEELDIKDYWEDIMTYGEWFEPTMLVDRLKKVMKRHGHPEAKLPETKNPVIKTIRTDVNMGPLRDEMNKRLAGQVFSYTRQGVEVRIRIEKEVGSFTRLNDGKQINSLDIKGTITSHSLVQPYFKSEFKRLGIECSDQISTPTTLKSEKYPDKSIDDMLKASEATLGPPK